MANRLFPAYRVFGFHLMPIRLDCQVTIGSTGAVSSFAGLGIKSVTRLAVGQYQIQLQDNYASLLSCRANFQAPVSGSAIPGGSFSAGTVYQIITLGTTTTAQWHTAGVPSGITPAVGVVFKAAGIGAGSGTVKVLGTSNIHYIETIGAPSTMLSFQPFQSGTGAFVTFQCLAPTDATTTTSIATDPASGSVMNVEIWTNNSAVQ